MGRARKTLLLASTALLAAAPARAQAPDARPQGGAVVAGQASITQTPSRTQVNQASNRAVIEWRGFDIGAQHQVDIRQPNAGSWSLQRVTGPDPSAIAGRLTSNGGVALVNPNGIVFHQGAQVDVAGLIATASDTTNNAFMAGRMAFDRAPRPGARVENRGTITVREQGLAALVGPVAANSGTIRARLGRVAIAGAEAFTLDLAGDGLLSFDVTRQVGAAPSGAAALATNTGVIEAEGGHVLLSAQAASGVLETLVSAGGSITAGTITATAPGGGVLVPGGALLDASGAQGGRVTIGAGAASRIGAPTQLSARSTVAPNATLRADGRAGPGGEVIVHAAQRTEMRGRASARGTPGGRIEISSRAALALDASLDAGRDGTVLLDPETLRIVETLSGATEPAEVTAATVNTTPGLLILEAERSIRVEAAVNRDAGPLMLLTTNPAASPGEGIAVNAPLTVLGDLRLISAGDITQAAPLDVTTLAATSLGGAVRLAHAGNRILALDGGGAATRYDLASAFAFSVDAPIGAAEMRLSTPGAISLYAPLSATGTLEIAALGGVTQQGFGAGLSAGMLALDSPFGAIALQGAGNSIAALGDVTAPFGLALRNAGPMQIAGVLNGLGAAVTLGLDSGDLTQGAAGRLLAGSLHVTTPGGSVRLDAGANDVSRLSGTARDDLVLDAGRSLLLEGRVVAARIDLAAWGDLTQVTDALLVTPELSARAIGGRVALNDPLNAVAALREGAADTGFSLATAGTLRLLGRLTAPDIALTPAGSLLQDPGSSIEATFLRVNALTGSVRLAEPNAIAALGASSAAQDFALASTQALNVTGSLDAGSALLLDAAALRLAAPLAAADMTLRTVAGGIAQEGGTLLASTLRAEATDGVNLAAAGNAIAALSGHAGSSFRIRTDGALVVDDIAAPEIALRAGGAIAQGAAALGIATDLLALDSGGQVTLGAATNAIRELGAVAAPGGLTLRTTTALRLTEPVATAALDLTTGGDLSQLPFASLAADTLRLDIAGNATLESPGNALPRLLGAGIGGDLALSTSGPLTLEGDLLVSGAMTLIAAGTLSQPAGVIRAPRLTARSVFGSVDLDGANRLGAVGGSAAGIWHLRDTGTAPLALASLIAAPEVTLTLGGGLDQGSGALRAEVLGLDVAGAVLLDSASHRVGALSGRAGALRLAAGGPLSVTGALEIGDSLALSADSIGLLAPVSASGPALLVALSGDVAQAASGAALRLTGALEVHASGAVALAGAGNQVPRLVAGNAGADFALASDGPLTLAGGISGEGITLRALGAMRLDGATFQAGSAVLLAAPAGIEAGAPSLLEPRDPARLPVLMLDTRRTDGLTAIPGFVQPDIPGLPAAQQPTQLADFGLARSAAAGGAAFAIQAGASPVFLLLDSAPSVGTLEAGRLGVLGQGGSAFLVGVVGGVGGEEAAALVTISTSEAGYLFNACPMGAASCGQTPPPGPGPSPDPGPEPGPGPDPGPAPEPPPPPIAGPDPSPPTLAGPPILLVPVRVDLWDVVWTGEAPVPIEGRPPAPSLWAPWPVAWPLRPIAEVE
ncbi:filamentous hemagglutinin N-terminal domain-containing protein [Roseomonas sp. AR75]|uniref:two-partner secretion domain-containing protein n=1 Tax=Roseomonas sp. AR75 TaxID=2562311 RepID=UPI001484F6AE|nr:filamentous hemagglutinin N-terminal domain-containing protein [Roseomonas sp. AR75]